MTRIHLWEETRAFRQQEHAEYLSTYTHKGSSVSADIPFTLPGEWELNYRCALFLSSVCGGLCMCCLPPEHTSSQPAAYQQTIYDSNVDRLSRPLWQYRPLALSLSLLASVSLSSSVAKAWHSLWFRHSKHGAMLNWKHRGRKVSIKPLVDHLEGSQLLNSWLQTCYMAFCNKTQQ